MMTFDAHGSSVSETGSLARRRRVSTATIGFSLLFAVELLLGVYVVPRNPHTIWLDPGWTAWGVAIANRISTEHKLYTLGLHIPIPPLSFVVLRIAGGGEGLWIHENVLDFAAQAGVILLLYLALRRVVPSPFAFFGALFGMPVYHSTQKNLLYDSLAMVWVAAALLCLVNYCLSPSAKRSRWLGLSAGAGALCFLTKHNVGAGLYAGAAITILLLNGWRKKRQGALDLIIFGITNLTVMSIALLIMSPWVDLRGFVEDILIHGSEPKGGTYSVLVLMLRTLRGFLVQNVPPLLVLFLFLLPWRSDPRLTRLILPMELDEQSLRFPVRSKSGPLILAAGLAGSAYGLIVLVFGGMDSWDRSPWLLGLGFSEFLTAGLLVALIQVIVFAGLSSSLELEDRSRSVALVSLNLALLLTGLVYSSSMPPTVSFLDIWDWLRFSAFPAAAIAVLLATAWHAVRWPAESPAKSKTVRRVLSHIALAGLFFFTMASSWSFSHHRRDRLAECVLPAFEEISFLKHCKVSERAKTFRSLTAFVREQTQDPRDAEVLLLPSDPYLEAWFERPRPPLMGACIYADQYWDRFVDEDFERLRKALPKVIVIGPWPTWKMFTALWQKGGASRLIQQVEDQLIPKHYEKSSAVEFTKFDGTKGFMDVYVRRGNRPH